MRHPGLSHGVSPFPATECSIYPNNNKSLLPLLSRVYRGSVNVRAPSGSKLHLKCRYFLIQWSDRNQINKNERNISCGNKKLKTYHIVKSFLRTVWPHGSWTHHPLHWHLYPGHASDNKKLYLERRRIWTREVELSSNSWRKLMPLPTNLLGYTILWDDLKFLVLSPPRSYQCIRFKGKPESAKKNSPIIMNDMTEEIQCIKRKRKRDQSIILREVCFLKGPDLNILPTG